MSKVHVAQGGGAAAEMIVLSISGTPCSLSVEEARELVAKLREVADRIDPPPPRVRYPKTSKGL